MPTFIDLTHLQTANMKLFGVKVKKAELATTMPKQAKENFMKGIENLITAADNTTHPDDWIMATLLTGVALSKEDDEWIGRRLRTHGAEVLISSPELLVLRTKGGNTIQVPFIGIANRIGFAAKAPPEVFDLVSPTSITAASSDEEPSMSSSSTPTKGTDEIQGIQGIQDIRGQKYFLR
ncbi:hypothetical protein SEMRO_7_G005680.1 [Seminavis robusta]|uniref:Uncharacterized protein n=1 Tax=Seminavis robusta TaxID=568900 RepID=A0A9N8D565_9STRA|nr:hypothetical protein SEMRO_7_G005680.1 [Seminavis robusta]|eukprot:Sro7_g005680.1 n/a (179) ;mRNA; r:1480-2096